VHKVWHVAVLAATLFGAAGLVIMLLGPLVLESSEALQRARPLVIGLLGLAAALLLVEWLFVH
jgi:hypothetical protein